MFKKNSVAGPADGATAAAAAVAAAAVAGSDGVDGQGKKGEWEAKSKELREAMKQARGGVPRSPRPDDETAVTAAAQ